LRKNHICVSSLKVKWKFNKLAYINSQELQRMATKSELVTGDFVIKRFCKMVYMSKCYINAQCMLSAYVAIYAARRHSSAENGYCILKKRRMAFIAFENKIMLFCAHFTM